jgi:glycerol kinase
MRKQGHTPLLQEKTGLVLDAYFSATKLAWLLDHTPGARAQAERGDLAFGTIDTWLLWKLTGGKVHATDPSNASRTLLFNLHTLQWDDALLKLFNIPRASKRRTLWRNRPLAFWSRHTNYRHHWRSTSSHLWSGLLFPWHGKEHVWHRLFHAVEYG